MCLLRSKFKGSWIERCCFYSDGVQGEPNKERTWTDTGSIQKALGRHRRKCYPLSFWRGEWKINRMAMCNKACCTCGALIEHRLSFALCVSFCNPCRLHAGGITKVDTGGEHTKCHCSRRQRTSFSIAQRLGNLLSNEWVSPNFSTSIKFNNQQKIRRSLSLSPNCCVLYIKWEWSPSFFFSITVPIPFGCLNWLLIMLVRIPKSLFTEFCLFRINVLPDIRRLPWYFAFLETRQISVFAMKKPFSRYTSIEWKIELPLSYDLTRFYRSIIHIIMSKQIQDIPEWRARQNLVTKMFTFFCYKSSLGNPRGVIPVKLTDKILHPWFR